jgi:hemolysin activation/secretion protein
MHIEGGWLRNPVPGEEFDFGLGTGPRAFGNHAFTGDRSIFATAEYRYTVVDNLGGMLGLGIAGFVDHGGAWYAGSRRRVGWDAGVGLRVGASRASDTPALRFDLARRFANDAEPAGWVLTVGKGFAFSTPSRGSN